MNEVAYRQRCRDVVEVLPGKYLEYATAMLVDVFDQWQADEEELEMQEILAEEREEQEMKEVLKALEEEKQELLERLEALEARKA